MIKDILKKLDNKNDLAKEEMQKAVESIMTGKVDDDDIENFLLALLSEVKHSQEGLFQNIESPYSVVRYHSLIIEKDSLPNELKITGVLEDNPDIIMAVQHKERPIYGVQFHPESIASVGGYRILAHFLRKTGKNCITDSLIHNLEQQTLRLDIRFPEQIHV